MVNQACIGDHGATVLLTAEGSTEIPDNDLQLMCDGVLHLTFDPEGRALTVLKVKRGTLTLNLAEADQSQLFTMFFRAEAVRNSKVRGAGLGLYITRMLLEMQNGQIEVKSCPGKGSTFSCRLPLAVAQPSDVAATPIASPPGESMLIMPAPLAPPPV